MDSVQEGDDLEKIRQRLEQMVILLMRQLPLHVQVPNEHQTGEGQNFLLPTAEPRILHVSLHDTYQGLGVGEIGVRDLVQYNRIAGADLADTPVFRLMNSWAGVALPPDSTWA